MVWEKTRGYIVLLATHAQGSATQYATLDITLDFIIKHLGCSFALERGESSKKSM